MTNDRIDIFSKIHAERKRQDSIHGEQNLPIKNDAPIYKKMAEVAKEICDDNFRDGTITWKDILEEEFWEVFAEDDPEKQAEELIQVAAVCVAMVECLRRNGKIQ